MSEANKERERLA